MVATIKELLTILGLLYLINCVLMGIVIYSLIIVRLADYFMHPEAFEIEEDYDH